MADNDVNIRFRVDETGAVKGFEDLDKALDNAGESAEQVDSTFEKIAKGSAKALAFGFASATAAFAGLAAIAKKGAEIDDLANSFERLSGQAGVTADVLLEDLNRATENTISNAELMRIANKGLLAGLDPSAFDEMAQAARAYADSVGGDAAAELEAFIEGMSRGDDRFLKSRGILLDNEVAFKRYALTIGKAADDLNELEKAEALKAAASQALLESTAKLGKANKDVADSVDGVIKRFADLANEVSRQIGTNEDLGRAFDDVANAIASVDAKQLAADLSTIAGGFARLASDVIPAATQELDRFVRGLKVASVLAATGFDVSQARALIDNSEALESQLKSVKSLAEVLKQSKSLFSGFAEGAKVTRAQVEQLARKLDALKDSTFNTSEQAEQFKVNFDDASRVVNNLLKLVEDTTPSISDMGKGLGSTSKSAEEAQKKLEKFNEEVKKANSVDGLQSFVSDLKKIKEAFDQGVISADQQTEAIRTLYSEMVRLKVPAENIGRVLDVGFRGQGVKDDAFKDWGNQIQAALGDAVAGAIRGAFAGQFKTSEGIKQGLGEIGGSLGALGGEALGDLIGGPIGGQIGAALGEGVGAALTDAAFDLFHSPDSPGTKFRKEVDKFFADAFEADRLQVIIDGQLKEISDLDFGGSDFGSTGSGFFAIWDTLGNEAKESFRGIAAGFAELTGQGQEFANNLAAAFSNNLGGSLNNLQLLVEATGKSFDDLKAQVREAFLDGKLSALETQTAFNGIARAAQKGIPDALGALDTAFENLKAAGVKGGRALIDALQDIGYEAKELGFTTLPQAQQRLAETGKFSADEIRQVFDTLATQGIDTIDELTSATQDQLIAVLSDLQANDFGFAKAVESAQELIDQVNKIPDRLEKTLVFNLKTNADAATRQAQRDGYIPNNATEVGGGGAGLAT